MRLRAVVLLLTAVVLCDVGLAQLRDEMRLRRADRGKEGVNPEEVVTFKSDLTFLQAMQSLSELSKRFANKPIAFDPNIPEEKKIGVDVQPMPWREALELILRTNAFWYTEQPDYFQVVSQAALQQQATAKGVPVQPAAQPAAPPAGQVGAPGGFPPVMVVDSAEVYATTREVSISAIFLEIDKTKLNQTGVNFSIFRGRDLNLGIEFTGAERIAPNLQSLLQVNVNPSSPRLAVDVGAALRFFESSGLGEVIARPQVTVTSGNLGRVQVGEDFSFKQRTIAGDVTEQFYSTGTILEVMPKVWNYQGVDFITLTVKVERSNLVDPATNRVAKTEASSRLLLLDGEESYVGGLFLNQETVTREGVPLLKDLPWWVLGLRYLFGYDKVETTRKELLVMMRAELVPQLTERKVDTKKDLMKEKLEQGREELRKRSDKVKD